MLRIFKFGVVCFCIVALTSCAAPPETVQDAEQGIFIGTIQRPYQEVWRAALLALEEMPLEIADEERGFIRTGWLKGWGEKKFGALAGLGSGGSWQRRARCLIWFHPDGPSATALKIHLGVEEKPPGGAMAYRWTRVAPEPEQVKDVFRDIESRCGHVTPTG